MAASRALLASVLMLFAGCTLPTPPPPPLAYYEMVLGAEPFTELVIEIDHAPGREPGEAALTHLRMTFENITQKRVVRIVVERSLPDAPQDWSGEALAALSDETRTTTHAAPVAVLHVLYPAGTYEQPDVFGVTLSNGGPAAIFLDRMRELHLPTLEGAPAAPPAPLPEESVRIIERATLLHEAGHAVGLVNAGLPMVCPHEDAEHEAHSPNPDSVMYYAVDSMEGVRKMLTRDGNVPDTFDANDLRDLQAGGGRGLPPPAAC